MQKLISFSLLLCFFLPTRAQQEKWQQAIDAVIHARLNDAGHFIDGTLYLSYTNNSPDTLHYIWMHLWANAFKNDLTAYSDQLLKQNNTDFYFSEPEEKGYINRLSFTVNGMLAVMENHPQHQDILKLILPKPLLPKETCKLFTPFHVQLPRNFGDGGYRGQTYQVIHWYPQPALYNANGWQVAPFLHQGIPNSEFGKYKVHLTLPANYKVAASGKWISETVEKNANKVGYTAIDKGKKTQGKVGKKSEADSRYVISSSDLKTLNFEQDQIQQFVWMADKNWQVGVDSISTTTAGTLRIKYFYDLEFDEATIRKSLKNVLDQRIKWHGDFPYGVLTAVVANPAIISAMQAGNLVAAIPQKDEINAIMAAIDEQAGLTWFKSATGVNPLREAWMAEGINNWYHQKITNNLVPADTERKKWPWQPVIDKRLPDNLPAMLLAQQIATRKDQPVAGGADKFSSENYPLSVHEKTANWLTWLASNLGEQKIHAAVKQYLNTGRFAEADGGLFKQSLADAGLQHADVALGKLKQKGVIIDSPAHKRIKLFPLFNFKQDNRYQYLYLAPSMGYNFYDKLMLGGLLHNYNLPEKPFQFLAAPMFGVATKKLNVIARAGYTWFVGNSGAKFTAALAASSFTIDDFTDSTGKKNYMRFSKLVPSLRYDFGNANPLSRKKAWLQWKTFLIREQGLLFTRDTGEQKDIITYPWGSRYLNQLQAGIENNRALYPWKAHFQAEQGDQFVRLAFTGNYFFNYAKGGGLDVRVFAGKFLYTTARTFLNQALTSAYHLNLTGPKGHEDYTYSNYFYGRSEFEGLASQQIMQRDGFFKVRTDLLSSKIGQTDNWLFAANFATTIPDKYNPLKVLPIEIPVKLFADIGTYAEAWNKTGGKSRFVFDAGVQLSLLKNTLNVYVPLLYSGVYRDYFKSLSAENTFFKRISFSIDINHLRVKHFIPQVAF